MGTSEYRWCVLAAGAAMVVVVGVATTTTCAAAALVVEVDLRVLAASHVVDDGQTVPILGMAAEESTVAWGLAQATVAWGLARLCPKPPAPRMAP